MFVEDYRKEGFTKEEWTWGLIGSAVFTAVMVLAGGACRAAAQRQPTGRSRNWGQENINQI